MEKTEYSHEELGSAREDRRQELERTYSHEGYSVIRKELFPHLRDPAMTIRNGTITFEPCAMNAPGAYALVNVKKEETYDVSSIDFVRMMYRENGWKKQISYRIAGTPHRQERAVEFDLTKALEIHEGRVVEP